ncbi:uncharacterized protein LOC135118783 [Helicoverpa armigera]|uniref:uncharacterized protein LOC135118783 n=1 Tax=Helicoverpa armigera TaxID=29058 RepID=UPI003083EA8E
MFTNKSNMRILFKNILDKDVQCMLWPLNLMQYMMLCPKYHIKNNLITPNSLISNIISIIATVGFISSSFYRTYEIIYYSVLKSTSFFISFVLYYDCIYYVAGFIMNCAMGILQTKNMVKFVLIFQKIHRFLNDGSLFRRYVIMNWIYFIAALGFFFIILMLFVMLFENWIFIIYGYELIFFDLNVVYFIRIIKLLEDKVVLYNKCLLNYEKHTTDESYRQKIFQVYVDLLECYNILKKCFQQFLSNSYNLTNAFFLVSFDINAVLAIRSLNLLEDKISLWNVNMYEVRRLCKNVLRLHRASFSKIRACGLFYVDAALQLALMSLLTNYVVVLLQFAFL